MGRLTSCKREVILRARHPVGRSRYCLLQLADRLVSGEHALLRWTRRGWEVRDLGSINGTFLNGQRLPPGRATPLPCGAQLTFGAEQPIWILTDDTPPAAMAVDEQGTHLTAAGDMLSLPCAADPDAIIFRDRSGQWVCERDESLLAIDDGQQLVVGGRLWRLHLPQPIDDTLDRTARPLTLSEIALHFTVSLDEETVHLQASHPGGVIDLHVRSHHYPLLTLARARLADAGEKGLSPGEHGWLFIDELTRMLGIDDRTLNVYVYRSRQQLAAAGVQGGAGLIERRLPSRQVRIGLCAIEITRA